MAANFGVTPESATVAWHVEFNEINDCSKLARYQSQLIDISVPSAGF